ncbi:MAG: AzlC family ABC transporter permease [Actinomycetota bacterium]
MIDRLRNWALPPGALFSLDEGLSLAFAYFTVGTTVTILHVTQGTGWLPMLGVIFVVNSVTPGLAYVAVVESGGSSTAGVLSGWLVSSRFGLFAAAIAPYLWPSMWRRAGAAHLAFDPNVALGLREPDEVDKRRVFLAAGWWMILPWWVGGVLGIIIGSNLGDPNTLGLDAIFPAVMLVIVWPQLRERDGLTIGLVALITALALVEITPGGVPALAAACAALLALRPPLPSVSDEAGA